MTMTVLAALAALAVNNDNHWTAEGAPRLDTMRLFTGNSQLTREMVTAAAPGVSRANPLQVAAEPVGGGSATPPAGVAPVAVQAPSLGSGNADGPATDAQTAPAGEAGVETLETAQAAYAAALRAQADAASALEAARTTLDREIEAVETARGVQAAGSVVAEYHDSQRRLLQERADRMKALKGINLKDILPQRAPIDAAFARKTGRGGNRPTQL